MERTGKLPYYLGFRILGFRVEGLHGVLSPPSKSIV